MTNESETPYEPEDTPVTNAVLAQPKDGSDRLDAVSLCRRFERVLWQLAGFLPGHGDVAEIAAQRVRDALRID